MQTGSKLSTSEIEEVLNQWQQQSQADIGITAKVYLLDPSEPEYEKRKKEAGDDSSPNKLIYTINTVGGFELSYKFDAPEWIRNLFGEVTIANEDCFRSYINESLAALRDMQAYYKVGETASQQELPGGQDYVIVDSSGKVWSIDESGHVTEGGEVAPGGASTASNTEGVSGSGSNAAVTQYAQGGVTITWDASNSIYAFDTPQATGLPGKNYQTLKNRQLVFKTFEAEWEYAARSADLSGGYIYSGNAGEWCSDWYGAYNSGAQTNRNK
ncbi:hypothetical protein FACS189413_04760 [Bacteroidia bacterium]|nr:hypothetical protein FACS189413_04760 [Bacteroidia bacterium]